MVSDALELLCENLDSLAFKNSVSAQDKDIYFLSEIMNNTITQSVVRAHETLDDCHDYEPVSCDNIELLQELLSDLNVPAKRNHQANKLLHILSNQHFQVNDTR